MEGGICACYEYTYILENTVDSYLGSFLSGVLSIMQCILERTSLEIPSQQINMNGI